MKINKISAAFLLLLSVFVACSKDELNVLNPNLPTPASAATEPGIIALAQGVVYQSGFRMDASSKFYDGV
ncbi:MAG: hypothetical protein RLZZ628_1591, partial [Bacteroidota bacterium]